jgi:hypothetical protein
LYNQKHSIKTSDTQGITITIQELIEIGIMPVLRQSVLIIISCLLDEFGYFEIAKLFVTGSFLNIKEHNGIYDHLIRNEMEKEFKRLIREKTYRTKFDLLIGTSVEHQEQSRAVTSLGYKHFCFDTFTKGELRVVASTTYMLSVEKRGFPCVYITSTDLLRLKENRSGLIICGDELRDKRILMDIHSDNGIKNDHEKLCKSSIPKTFYVFNYSI